MKTEDLKYILETFTNIVKLNPIRPVTFFVEMYCKDGVFRIGCTDGYSKIVATLLEPEDMPNVVLDREQLLKILKLTNKEDIKIIVKDDYVALRGCGNYKLPIQVDETGNQVQLNLSMPSLINGTVYEIDDIKTIFERNTICLGNLDNYECLNYYYYENGKVFTTDAIRACTTKAMLPQKFTTARLVKQLASLNHKYTFARVEQGARVDSDIFEMYFMYKDIEEYPIDMIRVFMGTEWAEYEFKICKADLVNALKRIDIFTKPWQDGKVTLTFDNGYVTILSEGQDANETIPVELKGNASRIVISEKLLLEILKKVDNDFTVYGSKKCIGLEDKYSLYVLSAMEE